jgi:hypothetical protein
MRHVLSRLLAAGLSRLPEQPVTDDDQPAFLQGLSARTRACLMNGGLTSIESLALKSVRELLLLPNFNRRALREVAALLAGFGRPRPVNRRSGPFPSWHRRGARSRTGTVAVCARFMPRCAGSNADARRSAKSSRAALPGRMDASSGSNEQVRLSRTNSPSRAATAGTLPESASAWRRCLTHTRRATDLSPG